MKPTLFAAPAALILALGAGHAAAQAMTQDWSGLYVGGQVGAGTFSDDSSERLLFDTNKDGNYNDTVRTGAGADAFSPGFCAGSPNGNNAGAGCQDDDEKSGDLGLRIGYDWQSGPWVFGVVGEISKLEVSDNVTGFSVTPAAYHMRREIDQVAALRGRIGYAVEDWLFYGTAGVARADIDRVFATTNGANSFTPMGGKDGNGTQVGLGVEKRMGNWSVGVEYLQTTIKDEGYMIVVGPGTAPPTNPFLLVNPTGTNLTRSSDEVDNQAIRLTVSYRFGM